MKMKMEILVVVVLVDLVQDLETKEVDRFADKSRKETKDAFAFLIKRVQLFLGEVANKRFE